MDNGTVKYFILTAYDEFGPTKYMPFIVFSLLYIVTVSSSLLLIAVIYKYKDLHRPMYIFVSNLAFNGIFGSTSLLPATLTWLASKTHEIAISWCITQVYFIHSYAALEFSTLSVMAYDRYVAICYPLQYHNIMTFPRTWKLVTLVWLLPLIWLLGYITFTVLLNVCEADIQKLYCVIVEVARNFCSSVAHISMLGIVTVLTLVMPQLIMIVFSYIKILRVCWELSRDRQRQALKTRGPHVLSVLNYSIGCVFEIAQSRFDMTFMPTGSRIFVSLYFIVIPPVLNPAMYGLGTHVIRVHVWKMIRRNGKIT